MKRFVPVIGLVIFLAFFSVGNSAWSATTPIPTVQCDDDGNGAMDISCGGTNGKTTSAARTNLGLGNVSNTSDVNKPISTATQAALNNKMTGPSNAVDGGIVGFDGITGQKTKQITTLPSGTTATTPSSSDISTKVATTAFVDSWWSSLWNRVGAAICYLSGPINGTYYVATEVGLLAADLSATNDIKIISPFSLTANRTIAHALSISPSSVITTTGYNFNINGPFQAGLYQCFSGTGSVVFVPGTVKEVYPEWWYSGSGSYTAAFNAAAASGTASGIPVYLTGIYACATALTSTTSIIGPGILQLTGNIGTTFDRAFLTASGNGVKLKDFTLRTYAADGAVLGRVVRLHDGDNIEVSWITVDNTSYLAGGIGLFSVAGSGGSVSNVTKLKFHHNTLKSTTICEGLGLTCVLDSSVDHNYIYAPGDDGIAFHSAVNSGETGFSQSVRIDNNDIYTGGRGVLIEGLNYDIAVEHNTITSLYTGSHFMFLTQNASATPDATLYPRKVRIHGNNFIVGSLVAGSTAIGLACGVDIDIDGNTVTDGTHLITGVGLDPYDPIGAIQLPLTDIRISNNVIRSPKYGIDLEDNAGVTYMPLRVTVANNQVYDMSHATIYAHALPNALAGWVFSGNQVEDYAPVWASGITGVVLDDDGTNSWNRRTYATRASVSTGETYILGQRCFFKDPVEAGTTPNKYVATGEICTVSGIVGSSAVFVPMRSLTGN